MKKILKIALTAGAMFLSADLTAHAENCIEYERGGAPQQAAIKRANWVLHLRGEGRISAPPPLLPWELPGFGPEVGFQDVWLARFASEETGTRRARAEFYGPLLQIAMRDNEEFGRQMRLRARAEFGDRRADAVSAFITERPNAAVKLLTRVDPERGEGMTTAFARARTQLSERAQLQSEHYYLAGGSPIFPNILAGGSPISPNILGTMRVERPDIEGAASTLSTDATMALPSSLALKGLQAAMAGGKEAYYAYGREGEYEHARIAQAAGSEVFRTPDEIRNQGVAGDGGLATARDRKTKGYGRSCR